MFYMHQPWHILWFYFNSFLNSITTLASIQLYKPVSRVYICSDWIRTQGRRTVPSRIWIHLTMAISKGQNANESGFIFAQMSSNQWRRQTLGERERERERRPEGIISRFSNIFDNFFKSKKVWQGHGDWRIKCK